MLRTAFSKAVHHGASSRTTSLVHSAPREACRRYTQSNLGRTTGSSQAQVYSRIALVTAGLGLAAYTLAPKSHAEAPSPSDQLSTQVNPAAGKTDIELDDKGFISMDEVARHNFSHDAWVVIDGKVWDVTNWLHNHPGGAKIIVTNAGKDVTEIFKPIHPPNVIETNLKPEQYIGKIDPELAKQYAAKWEVEQSRVKKAREDLPDVETILGLDEMEDAANAVMSDQARMYYGTGALDHITLEENKNAFKKCRFVPRIMRDVSTTSPQTTLFGRRSPLPIYISPASNALLGHPDAENNITRSAARTGIVQGVSAASSLPLEEILAEKERMDEEVREKWGKGKGGKEERGMGMIYQVYVQDEREKTEKLVREAVEGGVDALLLTVDTNVLGHRQINEKFKGTRGEIDNGIRLEPETRYPGYHDARLNWEHLDWLKSISGGKPIYLKGVCAAEDVKLAKEAGLAGVILSNHGGRQLDHARTGFDSLRSIHASHPDLLHNDKFEVYVDGGFKRGSDVLMAVALGARGVGFGRAFLWGQTAYGEQGVTRTIRILESEIVMAMRLLGVNKLSDLKPEMVECIQEVWR